MELTKAKFKQTEIGSMPEDWNIYKFDDIGETIIGLTYKPSDVSNTGKLVHRSSNIQNNKLAYHDNVYVTITIPEKLILREEDILICVRNGSRNLIGKSAIIQGISIGETFGAFMSVFRPKMYAPLVYQYFISNIVQSQINASLGATINQITNKTLNSFITFFPPSLQEQKSIATALSDVDKLISNLDQLITKKKAVKQGATQQLLTPPHKGGKRLAGFTGELVEKPLGNIGYFKNGMNKSAEDFGHGFPFVNLMDIFGISTITSNKHLGLINSSHEEQALYNLKLGDVLFVRSSVKPSGVGLTSVVLNDLDETVFSGFLIRYRTNEELDINYKIHCFHQKEFRNKVIAASSSSANTNINQEALKALVLTFPKNIEEQKAIAQILSDMDIELDYLETKKAKYQNIKQGMMQELLTGKTRLV
jgi:type I restriction enzyme S subunit